MASSCITLVSWFMLVLAYGQAQQQEWSPDELENPINKPLKCGLADSDPAYICDPNGILGQDVYAINWILKDAAYNSTKCPCSNYYCETTSKPTGYRIGVALVKKMRVQTSTDGKIIAPSDQAQIFAYTLENSKWNMGRCEEDIVVFYSVDDKALAIYTGVTAGQKLTSQFRNVIAHKAGSRLHEGKIVEGLNHIIHDIKMVLNCESLDQSDCNVYEFNPSLASVNVASISVAAVAILFTMLMKNHL